MPAVDHKLIFATAWSRSWPRTQVLPTKPASPAEPESHPVAAAARKPCPSTSAVTSKGQILPASPWADCWQAVDRREGRRVRAGERLLPAAPQSSSTALAATTPPCSGTWAPNAPCPRGQQPPQCCVHAGMPGRGICSPGPCQLGGGQLK